MKTEKQASPESALPFARKNYVMLIAGLVIMAIGFVIMAGGGSDDPNVFNEAIFSFRRLTLAPILILTGLVMEIFAIMARPEGQ